MISLRAFADLDSFDKVETIRSSSASEASVDTELINAMSKMKSEVQIKLCNNQCDLTIHGHVGYEMGLLP